MINTTDGWKLVKRIYGLNSHEVSALRTEYDARSCYLGRYFLGQDFDMPQIDACIGGVCLQDCGHGLTLESLYDVLMPQIVASVRDIPCIIMVPGLEEIIRKQLEPRNLAELIRRLTKAINWIANQLGVQCYIVNTLEQHINNRIEHTLSRTQIQLSSIEAARLYKLKVSSNCISKNSNSKVVIYKRFIAFHTQQFLKEVFDQARYFVAVENIQQRHQIQIGNRHNSVNIAHLAYVPLLDTAAQSRMLKAPDDRKLRISDSDFEGTVYTSHKISQKMYKDTCRRLQGNIKRTGIPQELVRLCKYTH